MATVILLRHARSSANGAGILAGRTPKVGLDDTGLSQARALVDRLAGLPLVGIITSPLQRCRQTVAPLAGARKLPVLADAALSEVDYGEWTGRALKTLAKEALWSVVQQHPSAARFPGGEGLADVAARATASVRDHDQRINTKYGPDAIWLACSHGDVIKAVLADGLGLHLDSFQRIVVDPCSVSVIRYTETRPFVLRVNDHGSDLASIVPPPKHGRAKRKKTDSDAVPGGSTGIR